MAEAVFRPVRCMDGKTAHGVELVLDSAEDMARALPQLVNVLCMMQDHLRSKEMEQDFRPAVDAAAVCLRVGRRSRLRCAVQLRLHGPEDASPGELQDALEDLACLIAPYLTRCGAPCDTPVSAADGVLCAFPDGQRPCAVHALLRPHQTAVLPGGSRFLWYRELPGLGAVGLQQAMEIIRGCPGSGISLHLQSAKPLQRDDLPALVQDERCRQRLAELMQPGALAVQCILWETPVGPENPFLLPETPALAGLLQLAPGCTALPLGHEGLALQLAHDPEAVRGHIVREAGGRYQSLCGLCTPREIARFWSL